MSDKVILKIEDITKTYGSKVVLNKISFLFLNNRLYAIKGESGGGKTTLLNILGLIDSNYDGKIIFDDEVIKNKKDYSSLRAKKIGFIFQSYYLIDSLNVRENVLLPLKYSKNPLDEEYLSYIVDKLNISHLLNEKVNYLSGGEKQRVAIARALINKPKLIICDEPTGNLDEKNAINVIEILKTLLNDDRTIILVTHTSSIAEMCTNIIHLGGGNLYE